MDKHYFIKLLQKYQQGDLTKEELIFLESYYNLFQNEPDVLDMLNVEEKNEFKNEIRENIRNNISKEKGLSPKIRFINKRFIKTAAAAAVIGMISSLFYFYYSPAGKQAPASLAIRSTDEKSNKPLNATLVVHQKENRAIFLPDGSKVILSPGSKLNYPSSFDGMDKREVFLDGQAFFDIKHNVSRLFIVHTGKLETIVLGTAFNIKALPREKDITVTVKRGKVKVSDQNKILGIIAPNQQITYDKQKVNAVLKMVDNDSYLDWKDEDLFIDNLTISEAAKLMEDRYKVKIIIKNPEVESLRFTTTFSKNETLEQTLNSICLFNGLVYTYNKEKSIVNFTPK